MTTVANQQVIETKTGRQGVMPNVISGLATGLFSIPEGMAYAQLAGVNPVYGLYSGVVAVIVSSLSTGTFLMTSTLTSAIALATASVLQNTGIQDSQMPQAERSSWEAAQAQIAKRSANKEADDVATGETKEHDEAATAGSPE